MLFRLQSSHILRYCALGIVLTFAASSGWAASPVTTPVASTPTPAMPPMLTATTSEPDPSLNPVLARIVGTGAKLYYMGNRAGLDGWFILKDNQMQIVYATPDNKAALIGAMFGQDGENITALQVQGLVMNNQDVASVLGTAAHEQEAITKAGLGKSTPPVPSATPPAVSSTSVIPVVSISPGERLLQDFTAAHGVVLGSNSAPELFMVIKPDCPHCQATWRAIRDSVFNNKVRIHLIPIGTPDTDEERTAGTLLHVKDPLNAWDKYVAGDKTQLAGAADPAVIAEVHANYALISSWDIEETPYLAYRGKDGKIKVLQGEPEKISSVLDDLI